MHCVQRTCGVVQSAISLAREYVSDYIQHETENVSVQTVMMTHRDYLALWRRFRPATYLLTD